MSYCRVDETAVFLDVRRNRYSALPWAAAKPIVHHDPGATPSRLTQRMEAWGWFDDPSAKPRPRQPDPVALEELGPDFRNGHTSPRLLAQSLWLLGCLRVQLAARRLEQVLTQVSIRNSAITDSISFEPDVLAPTLAAFRTIERYALRNDTCLLRSLALQAALAKQSLASSLVIGVKLHPFEAHCWLQHGTTLLNDTVERIGLFVPIRVVS
ncbi:lasso peptide biosynthesis B2 protein [Novosphingobium fluoreni]|uniref:lasso peptide biosynthesis B2 protein n=1 Tax=Novosphingobium fluoreni TaxID=1391222 RepID=UPI001609EFEC